VKASRKPARASYWATIKIEKKQKSHETFESTRWNGDLGKGAVSTKSRALPNIPVAQRKGSETRMERKARFVFPVVITAIIVFVVSGALTFFNIGWRNDFVIRWWSAFAIGWPIAASTAYLAMPFARSLTQRIVAAIERTV
jgi:hypothetical protein